MDVSQYAGDTVKIQKHITADMSIPRIVEARVSQSGKSIIVERHNSPDMRLDTETIMSGDCEYRSSYCLQLYDPETFQSVQRANYSPIPGVGNLSVTNCLTDESASQIQKEGCQNVTIPQNLPEPSHEVSR